MRLIDDDLDNAAYLDEVDLTSRESRARLAGLSHQATLFDDPELVSLTDDFYEEEDVD